MRVTELLNKVRPCIASTTSKLQKNSRSRKKEAPSVNWFDFHFSLLSGVAVALPFIPVDTLP